MMTTIMFILLHKQDSYLGYSSSTSNYLETEWEFIFRTVWNHRSIEMGKQWPNNIELKGTRRLEKSDNSFNPYSLFPCFRYQIYIFFALIIYSTFLSVSLIKFLCIPIGFESCWLPTPFSLPTNLTKDSLLT
jgi:hypothetical protein